MKMLPIYAVLVLGSAVSAVDFVSTNLVPDVVDTSPSYNLTVVYGGTVLANGDKPSLAVTLLAPAVAYPADPTQLYTLIFINADAVVDRTACNTLEAADNTTQYLLWLVTNIPGDAVGAGEVVTSYAGPLNLPPPLLPPLVGGQSDRLAFLVFRQTERIPRNLLAAVVRNCFSTRNFLATYKLDQSNYGGLVIFSTGKVLASN